jgi:mono/diheme cytochrome c family protein
MQYPALILVVLAFLLTGCNDNRGDSKAKESVVDSTTTPDDFLTSINNPTLVDSKAYANKYYETIDPDNTRDTLAKWRRENGFDDGADVHVTFRDTKDLGYGRDMYAKELPNGRVAVYVDNYIVEIEPGDATQYGPLNLDAAIAQDRDYHFGTNAIEFSPAPDSPNPEESRYHIAKFFTFGPRDNNGVQHRLTSADLDGRGVKNMPTMCVLCHGSTMYPLTVDGEFNPLSLKSPKMNILEQDTFQFSSQAGFTEADQEAGIFAINAMVYNTYVATGKRPDNDGKVGDPALKIPDRDDRANWESDFAEQLVELAYGDPLPGDGILDRTSNYTTDNVPAGWAQTAARPDGVETLYRQVIAPHCIGCHSPRGTQIASKQSFSWPLANATNFSSYEEFIGYNDLIIDYVYRRGDMPRSLINFSQFWDDPETKPTLLASYLTGFDVFDGNGKIVMPGRAVAIPGADRTVTSPVILDATASMFTTAYSWRIVSSTADPEAILDDSRSAAPVLTAADGTIVELELTTSNDDGNSEPVAVSITIDNSLFPAPADLTFVNDIMALDGVLGSRCVFCHKSNGVGDPGIPVYFDQAEYTGFEREKDLYINVLDRINLDDPENSLLLRKPTSLQHGGGVVLGVGDTDYNTLLNWIRNGAPCGEDVDFCGR